jgi:ammonia channel protein AmtB
MMNVYGYVTGCVGTHALSGFWGMLAAGLFIRDDSLLEALYLQGATAGAFYVSFVRRFNQ